MPQFRIASALIERDMSVFADERDFVCLRNATATLEWLNGTAEPLPARPLATIAS